MPHVPKDKKVAAPAAKPVTKTEHVKPDVEHAKKPVAADKPKGKNKGKAK